MHSYGLSQGMNDTDKDQPKKRFMGKSPGEAPDTDLFISLLLPASTWDNTHRVLPTRELTSSSISDFN